MLVCGAFQQPFHTICPLGCSLPLFVNFALQEGMDEDWPLEIYDHAGRVHRVHMEPGDIVLYVSSKKKPWGDVACQLNM